ncbi:hypothetical protein HK103_006561 [Boothiomyces macroporosus]|uniref:E2F-associated phosphoprotein n=1 Tax=Boothiomyces macroporosus TaxID=261099 RepID=A0AAD5UEC1_9FUNG|nr:hypothetical protein HK103_006561 [Boothiomyces macroporosus]
MKTVLEKADQQVESDPDDDIVDTAPDFYDPEADERDAQWVSELMNEKSDAILHCPLCFTRICYDCQKHTEYNQYRAMFVFNLKVIKSELLNKEYHPVECRECGCRVAVYDQEEVYHFYHFIAEPLVVVNGSKSSC